MPKKSEDPIETREKLSKQYTSAQEAIQKVHDSFDELERVAYGKRADFYSRNSSKSQVSEGGLSAILMERSVRVTAQFPTGKIQSFSKKDQGKNMMTSLAWENYVLPNSNAQYDHLTKLQMVDFLSKIYGSQVVLYDYRVDDEYIGPDFWIIPMRHFFPQPGKFSINDCEWVMISTAVTTDYLKRNKDKDGWNKEEIERILEQAGDNPRSTGRQQERRQGINEVNRQTSDVVDSEIELVTKYERGKKGKWITFAPDYDNMIVREIDNPHESGRIPVVLKNSFPLIDSIIGLGDAERSSSLQKAIDSLYNLYLDGVKYSIFPPLKIDTQDVVASSIRYQPNAKWRVLNGNMNAIQSHQVSPQGINSFVVTYQNMRAALLNLNGTTDTRISEKDGNPAFGKTPEALKQQAQREDTRDFWDRRNMELFIEELYDGMINLLSSKQEKPIEFFVSGADIKKIVEMGYEDVVEMFDSAVIDKNPETGQIEVNEDAVARVTLSKSHIKSQYKYTIDAGSTMSTDDQDQVEKLQNLLLIYTQMPQLRQELNNEGKDLSISGIFKQIAIRSGIKDWDKIIPDFVQSPEQIAPTGQDIGMGQMDPMTGQPMMAPDQVPIDPNDPLVQQVSAFMNEGQI